MAEYGWPVSLTLWSAGLPFVSWNLLGTNGHEVTNRTSWGPRFPHYNPWCSLITCTEKLWKKIKVCITNIATQRWGEIRASGNGTFSVFTTLLPLFSASPSSLRNYERLVYRNISGRKTSNNSVTMVNIPNKNHQNVSKCIEMYHPLPSSAQRALKTGQWKSPRCPYKMVK